MRVDPAVRRAAARRSAALLARRHRVAGASSRGRGGFTLAEIIVVVAIIALISTTMGLRIDSILPRERLNTAVRELGEALRGLRSDAISRSLTFYIQYDLENDRYRQLSPFSVEGGLFVEGEDDDEERFVYPWKNLPPGIEFASFTMAGRTWTSGEEMFARFDARGSASDHQIVLFQPEYEAYSTIEVLALTGTFKFHRGLYEREVPDDMDFQ